MWSLSSQASYNNTGKTPACDARTLNVTTKVRRNQGSLRSRRLGENEAICCGCPGKPFFSEEILAKFALDFLAEKGTKPSDGEFPDVGDMWKYGYPKGPTWESEDEDWSEDESVSSSMGSLASLTYHLAGRGTTWSRSCCRTSASWTRS